MTFARSSIYILAALVMAPAALDLAASPATGSAERVPQALPLGPGDQVEITVQKLPEMQAVTAAVDDTGALDLPMVGRIKAGGMSPEQIQRSIEQQLSSFMHEPSVRLRVLSLASRPVSVLGAVKQPGVHQLQGEMRLMEVLSLAGGLREDAGYSIKISRSLEQGELPLPNAELDVSGRFSLAEVDLQSLMGNESPAHNILIRPQDVITAPRAKLVYVIGEVNRSGGFVLAERQSMSVLQALAMAEGVKGTASAGKARIIREVEGTPTKEEIPVDVKKILNGRQEDLALLPDDVLFIPNSATKSAGKLVLGNALDVGKGIVIFR
jgi:polysaccharide biosynthesis/export protein